MSEFNKFNRNGLAGDPRLDSGERSRPPNMRRVNMKSAQGASVYRRSKKVTITLPPTPWDKEDES